MFAGSMEPILRRSRRSAGASRPITAAPSSSSASSTSSSATTPAAAAAPAVTTLPVAEPCFNYFELYPEEVGAVGNVEVTDAAEAYLWQLVGRRVSGQEAEQQGGCVKVMLPQKNKKDAKSAEASSVVFYSITGTDDEVYGRASYLPRRGSAAAAAAAGAVRGMSKEEPAAFMEDSNCDCTTDGEEGSDNSTCTSPCVNSNNSSVRCVYPTAVKAR